MRGGWVVVACLVGCGALTAAPRAVPVSRQTPAAHAANQEQAAVFAQSLVQLAGQVQAQYVRPVDAADLLHAALSGVYKAARLGVPRDLHDRLRKAGANNHAVADTPIPAAPPGRPVVVPNWGALIEVVRQAYDEAVGSGNLEGQKPLLLACQAMARTLDPHTVVITPQEARQAQYMNQTYDGLGLDLEPGAHGCVIRTVLPGSPAQQIGLRPGDEVLRLDGKAVSELPAAQVRARLQQVPTAESPGLPDTATVVLDVRRPGHNGERTLRLRRERFHPDTVLGVARHPDNSWDYWLDRRRGIAHVRIGPLAGGTASDLGEVLARLRDEGLRGLVLDLRWCPGGFIKEASGVAELFLGPALVATVKQREGEDSYRSAGEGKFLDFPVVVLINADTSGGGELIAAALQDHRRAKVAGQRSRGKASVQTSLSLEDIGLKLTTGTFLRPSGKNLHRFPTSWPQDDWGVRPDAGLELRLSRALGRQLEQWWLLQSLRPGSSNEALPLDDPEADPQRQAAAAALLQQLEHAGRSRDQ
jgi:carboxyl-terminal processing protease